MTAEKLGGYLSIDDITTMSENQEWAIEGLLSSVLETASKNATGEKPKDHPENELVMRRKIIHLIHRLFGEEMAQHFKKEDAIRLKGIDQSNQHQYHCDLTFKMMCGFAVILVRPLPLSGVLKRSQDNSPTVDILGITVDKKTSSLVFARLNDVTVTEQAVLSLPSSGTNASPILSVSPTLLRQLDRFQNLLIQADRDLRATKATKQLPRLK